MARTSLKQKLMGRKRYPLVLMLEPLFRCNLACAGCGKIDYPDPILNRRLSVQECLDAVDECGAPMVAIPGGEPLIHKDIGEIVKGHRGAQEVRLALHQRAAAREEARRVRALALPVLLGPSRRHQGASRQVGVHGRRASSARSSAIKAAQAKGFAVNVNATIFDGHPAEDIAAFLDSPRSLASASRSRPATPMSARPTRQHFLARKKTKELFRKVFALGKGKGWQFMHSGMFLDFLAGNQEAHCTPWGMPTRNIFGWQKPCYLLGEGYAKTFKELMETTDWDSYGTGAYEKCANCMAHCGYEPTAADLPISNPLKALKIALFGVRTEGPMAPEISLANQRPAQYVFAQAGGKDADRAQCREGAQGGREGQAAAAKQPAPHHMTAAE